MLAAEQFGQMPWAQDLSDEQLVERVRGGEWALYGLLVKRHQGKLYRLARRILGNDAEAEDALQEAHIRALTHLDQFVGRSKFATWMTRITLNEAFACIRRRWRHESLDAAWLPADRMTGAMISSQPDPEQQVLSSELRELLGGVVQALPGAYRTLLGMRTHEEMSVAEAAERLGISEECAKARLHRARLELRQRITRQTRYKDLAPAA